MRKSNKRGLTRDLLAVHSFFKSSLLETLISLFFIVSQEEFFYCVILEENINHHLSCSCV
jgi:hypothetical protein